MYFLLEYRSLSVDFTVHSKRLFVTAVKTNGCCRYIVCNCLPNSVLQKLMKEFNDIAILYPAYEIVGVGSAFIKSNTSHNSISMSSSCLHLATSSIDGSII